MLDLGFTTISTSKIALPLFILLCTLLLLECIISFKSLSSKRLQKEKSLRPLIFDVMINISSSFFFCWRLQKSLQEDSEVTNKELLVLFLMVALAFAIYLILFFIVCLIRSIKIIFNRKKSKGVNKRSRGKRR